MKTTRYLYLIYIFILSSIKINSFSNIAVIPFKTYYYQNDILNSKFTPLDYYKLFHLSNIYLEIEVGSKNIIQILSLFINIDDYIFYIEDNTDNINLNNNICRYSTKLSNSFKRLNSDNIIYGKTSFYGSDYFKIYTDLTKDKNEIIKMEFIYYKNNMKNISYACGKVGFLFPSDKKSDLWKRNFLNQINKGLNIRDYSFTLKYNNEQNNKNKDNLNSGLFIIGIESYEKNISHNNDLIIIYNKADQYGNKQKYSFELDNIYINNKYFSIGDTDIKVNLMPDIEGFEFPKYIFNKLNEIYFNKYYNCNKCKKEIIDTSSKYIIIYCEDNKYNEKDISIFPEISLFKYKLGFNFTFTGEELFYKKDNKYFFKILFYLDYFKKEFNLGRLFLKKYQVIFNPDSNYMAFYKNIIIKEKNEIQKNNNLSSLLLRYFFIIFIFLSIGFFLGRKFCILRKNKNAIELVDNDDYIDSFKIKEI